MKILILEDRGSVFEPFREVLEDAGHEVLKALEVSEAKDLYWKNKDIDWFIIDLYVPPTGLQKDELPKTDGGLLSGWIWVKNYLLKDKPDIRNRIIIFSDYTKIFKEKVPVDERLNLQIFNKSLSSIKEVIEYIKEHSN